MMLKNNCWKANKYELDDATPAKLILTCGANIYGDFFFIERNICYKS